MALEGIFRAYDVRGRVDEELTPAVMERIGRAAGTEIAEETIIVGRDVRPSSEDLLDAFIDGVTATGTDVRDAGLVPYGPLLYAGAASSLPTAYVTASHLSAEWNGIKFADADGIGWPEERNNAIKERFFAEDFASGDGTVAEDDILQDYRRTLQDRVQLRNPDVLMDCGNGAASVVAPDVFWSSCAQLEVMNGDPDGTFPNRSSDVTPESLEALRDAMRDGDHDVGIAYDGDADRVAVVDEQGGLLSSEETAALLLATGIAGDGPVVANVECSRLIEDVAPGAVHRVRVGHSYLFAAVKEHGACLGVEKSRHMGLSSVIPLNDGIATSLAVTAAVEQLDEPLHAFVDALPTYHRDRTSFDVPDEDKFAVVGRLQEDLAAEYDRTSTVDGVRVDLDDGWILIRASNTSPKVRLTVEADTEAAHERLHDEFSARLEDTIDAVQD